MLSKLFKGKLKSVTINGKTLEVVSKVAEGGFGFVYLAKDVNTNQQFALKQLIYKTEAERLVYLC